MTTSTERIPILIVAGFLGTGKTTFIRNLLPQFKNSALTPYVILNDFLNAAIDAHTLKGLGAEISTLAAGCVCCEDPGSLIKALEEIPKTHDPIVFIEANGTTDPFPLIELLTLDTALAERFGPVYQITVINESRWQKRFFSWDKKIERAQAATASHLLTNRSEKASLKQQARVMTDLESLNPNATRTTVTDFIAELLAISSESTARLNPAEPIGHAHHHLALRLNLPPMREDILVRWLLSFPPEVLRIKGLVRLIDDPIDDACFFQRTDDEWGNPSIIKTFMPEGAEPCAVFIGNGMDEAKIRKSLESFFYHSSPATQSKSSGVPSVAAFLANRCK